MTGKSSREYQTNNLARGRVKPIARRDGYVRRPFWLPASNYYVLTAAVAIAVFFFVWGILLEGGEEMPWVWSGMTASFVLFAAVFLREIVLRKARARFLLTEKRLDANVKNIAPPQQAKNANADKLTIEKNAVIVREIRQKSEAARLPGKSSAHLEVFEICNEYLSLNRRQMDTVGVGSPRLAALRRGREVIESLHRFHLLSWAQSESLSLTRESKIRVTMSDKLEAAQKALTVLDSALSYYPDDDNLLESERAVREFASAIKVSHWIEQAERAAFKGNYKRAVNHYRDALFFMARDGINETEERRALAEKINGEIERLHAASAIKSEGKKLN